MAIFNHSQGLQLISLFFSNDEQSKAYFKELIDKGLKSRFATIFQLLVNLIICGYLFINSKFDRLILLAAGFSLLAWVLSFLLKFQTNRWLLQAIILLSKISVFMALLVKFTIIKNNEDNVAKFDLIFICGVVSTLNFLIGQNWISQIILTCSGGVLFIIFLELKSFSWIVGSFSLFSIIASIYQAEKTKRLDFISKLKYQKSLKNWENFIDAHYQDPIFALTPLHSIKRQNELVSISELDPSTYSAHIRLMKYSKSSLNNGNSMKLSKQRMSSGLPPLSVVDGAEIIIDQLKNRSKQEFQSKIVLEQTPEPFKEEECIEESFKMKFQNLACQREFYKKSNQSEYFLKELKQIFVKIPFSKTIEMGNILEDNLSFRGDKQKQSMAQSKSAATANFIQPQTINNIEISQNIQSNPQILFDDSKSSQKSTLVSLSTFLAKKLENLKYEDSKFFEKYTSEEEGLFEAKELDLPYYCYRVTQTRTGNQIKYYQIKTLRAFFQGELTLMCILKDITEKLCKDEKKQIEVTRDILLQSLVQEIKVPLSRITNYKEGLSFKEEEFVAEDSSHASLNKRKINSFNSYLLQALYQINDIQDFLSLINGTLELSKRYFSLNSLLYNLKTIYKEDFVERNISLKLNNFIDSSETIYSDFQRIQQILVNLLSLSLNYIVEGSVSISLSFYDTKKETLEIALILNESVLPSYYLEQLSKSFSQFDNKYSSFSTGKNLQLLLCSALIEKLGPPQAFIVSQDDKNAEIRFKIFTNLQSDSKQMDSKTQQVSFNRDNGTLFIGDSLVNKRLLTNSTQNNLAKKNIRGPSSALIDITASETSSPLRLRQIQGSMLQFIKLPQIPSFSNVITPIKQGQNQSPQIEKNEFESACLLTEEITEKKEGSVDHAIIFSKDCSNQRTRQEIDTNLPCQVSGDGTAQKIRSTTETCENGFVNELNSYLSQSRILIINRFENSQPNKESLTNLLQKIENIEINSVLDCHSALRLIIEAQNIFDIKYPFKLIIINLSSHYKWVEQTNSAKEDIYTSIQKMQTFITNILQIEPIPVIIASNQQIQDPNQQVIKENKNIEFVQEQITLENLTLTLRKPFFQNPQI